MKNTLFGVLLSGVFLVSGCDEQARSFAARTRDILDRRSVEVSKKISVEMQAFQASAGQATEDSRNLANDSLANERSERADRLAVDYRENRTPVSHWRSQLFEYAQIDYATRAQILTTDLDAKTLYMQRYEELKLEQDKLAALSRLLTVLAAKQSLKNDVGAISEFAEETKQDFDQKICADLKLKADAGHAGAGRLYADKKCKGSE